MNPLLRPHCRSCQCVTLPVTHQPTNAAAGVPNINVMTLTTGAAIPHFPIDLSKFTGAAGPAAQIVTLGKVAGS